jgi:hypothetical protein
MKSASQLLAVVIIAGGIGTVNAQATPEENQQGRVRVLSKVPELNLGADEWDGRPQIHRIRTAAAFERLGGQEASFPFDFASEDLVIVRGSTGCAHGQVQFTTHEDVVEFTVRVTDRCTHLTCNLHHFPYASAFALAKDETIAPTVFVTWPADENPMGNLTKMLKNTKVTHLHLSCLDVTDADLVNLKAFKNLTHLYLWKNRITDDGLANLSHLTELYQLYLGENSGITDAGLEHLKDIMTSRIQILDVSGTSITQDGVKRLEGWAAQQKSKNRTQINHSLVTPRIHE